MAKTFKMNNGLLIPSIGLGTWQSSPGDVYNAVKYAIEEAGYRHIDCAFAYQNEEEIGKAIKEVIANGAVKREDLFITTKLWNTYHSRESVAKCCKLSLSKLDVGYIDLYLIHWPMGFKEGDELFPTDGDGKFSYSEIDYIETWQGMEDCVSAGLVKSIGLSNFNSEQIKRVLRVAKVNPVINQVECNPYLNQSKLIEFCKSHEIVVTAYSPLGSPAISKNSSLSVLNEPKLVEIADKHNKSIAQVLIRYQIQRGLTVIPKSVSPTRILSNIQVFDFEMSPEEMLIIDSLDCNHRCIRFDPAKNHKYYPFLIPF